MTPLPAYRITGISTVSGDGNTITLNGVAAAASWRQLASHAWMVVAI